MKKQFYVYIITNKLNTVLYIGFTGNLRYRVLQHKEKRIRGFTQRYNVTKLVYFEAFGSPQDGIAREKQLKAGSRQKKMDLIGSMNSSWEDLFYEIL